MINTCTMDMDNETGEPSSIRQTYPRKRTPLSKIYHLLVSRLSAPLLASLILLPILPSSNRHLIFELVPFYKTLKCLLSTPSYASNTQQWLSYWAIYASVRFLEETRCNLSTKLQRREALHNALEKLPRMLGERVLRLLSLARRRATSTTPSELLPRDMTLATQLAGSSTRWIVIKAILLFYAMDEELQGARRIIQKVIKPFFGFFTSLDEEYDENVLSIQPARRTHVNPSTGGLPLKLNLEDKQEEDKHKDEVDDEVCM